MVVGSVRGGDAVRAAAVPRAGAAADDEPFVAAALLRRTLRRRHTVGAASELTVSAAHLQSSSPKMKTAEVQTLRLSAMKFRKRETAGSDWLGKEEQPVGRQTSLKKKETKFLMREIDFLVMFLPKS